MPGPFRDYYQILGVSPDATDETIRERRRLLQMAWHPDKFQKASDEDKDKAQEELKRANEATEKLLNAENRKVFDEERRRQRHIPPEPRLSATRIDFGTLKHGETKTLAITVTNNGGHGREVSLSFGRPTAWVACEIIVNPRRTPSGDSRRNRVSNGSRGATGLRA